MIYTIKVNPNYYRSNIKGYIKRQAFKRLLYFSKATTEILLDQFLYKTYGVSLITACRLIITGCKITMKSPEEYTVTLPNLYLDKIARTIMFGTGKIGGSSILKFIFSDI